MDYKFHTIDELREMKGKHVWINASHRMNRYGLIPSHYRVVGVIEPTKEFFLEPLIPEYKNRLVMLPISFCGIEWGVGSISDPESTEQTQAEREV